MTVGVVVKRLMDVAGAGILLTLTAPLLVVIAVLVRADSPGPVLFRQTRVGQGGRPFTLLKFRTMRVGADREWQPPSGPKALEGYYFQVADDPRITRVGRFLRKTSLDELPQLLNVLAGQMSLVGPRPDIPEMTALYPPDMQRRHAVKPGLTGLAQVAGRGDLSTLETLRYDVLYCDTWSLWLDVRILAKTARQVLFQRGAR